MKLTKTIHFDIGRKLLLLLLLSSALSVLLVGLTLGFMARQLYRSEAAQTFSAARESVINRVQTLTDAVRQEAMLIAARNDVVSTVSMVFHYQSPEEYQPWVFDLEKQSLARELRKVVSHYPEHTDEHRIAVYDAHGGLMSFVVTSPGGVKAGYITFVQGVPTPVIAEVGTPEQWETSPLPPHLSLTCTDRDLTSGMDCTDKDLVARASAPVVRQSPDGNRTTVGHVTVGEILGRELTGSLSKHMGTHLSFAGRSGVIAGNLNDSDLGADWRLAAVPLQETGIPAPWLDTGDHYLQVYSLRLVGSEQAYAILGIEKVPVLAQIAQTRVIVIGVLLLVALIVTPVGLAVARRVISDPVRELVENVGAIRDGRYAIQASDTQDELGVLSRAIRDMAGTIHEREQQLRQSREGLAEAQRLARLGNWTWDCDNGRLLCSDEVFRILGVAQDYVSGDYRYILPFVREDDRRRIAALLETAVTEGSAYDTDYHIVRPGGDVQVVHEKVEVQLDETGRPRHLLGTLQVVTEFKKVEQALRKAHAAAESHLRRSQEELTAARSQLVQAEKMAAIGQLAAGVAHEINNPMGYINSNFHTLQYYVDQLEKLFAAYAEAREQLPDGHPAKTRLTAVENEVELPFMREDLPKLIRESREGGDRVKKIVMDLKNFARQDESQWEQASVNDLCDRTLNIVHNELKYKADVVHEYGEVPCIRCLPVQLEQVLVNLLVNAAQAIQGRGTITVRTGTEEGRVFVEVEDTGSGIKPEHLPHLFEPFFTTKPPGAGTGLGLSVSYNIVQRHGGDILVDSTVGLGSRFRVRLPLDGFSASEAA